MRLQSHFDVDALFLVPREAPVVWERAGDTYLDEFGRRFRLAGGFYNQADHPLLQGTAEELAAYKFPDVSSIIAWAGWPIRPGDYMNKGSDWWRTALGEFMRSPAASAGRQNSSWIWLLIPAMSKRSPSGFWRST